MFTCDRCGDETTVGRAICEKCDRWAQLYGNGWDDDMEEVEARWAAIQESS